MSKEEVLRGLKESFLAVVTGANFVKSLVAVLAGNAIYFLLLVPVLPPVARHKREQIDLGLVIDFWVCLVMYGVVELIVRRRASKRRSPSRR